MELSKVLFGGTRGAILALLFGHTEGSFYLREIVRASGYGLGPVQRELKILTDVQLITRSVRGIQVFFQANAGSPVFQEIKSLIMKTAGAVDVLRAALSPLAEKIEQAFIYGSVAKGREKQDSDIDLFVIGNVTFLEVVGRIQEAQMTLAREINPTVYSVEEFRSRVREKRPFPTSILNEPKLFVLGNENGLARLADQRLDRPT